MTRTVRYLLVLLAAAALGAGAYAFAQVRPLPVELAGIESDVAIQVFGLGTVEARIRSDVGFEVGAALVELNADHGDRVAKGAVLARLHRAEQEARVAQAEAGVKQAEAALDNAAATVDRAKAVLAQHKPYDGVWPNDFLPERVAEAKARFAKYLDHEAGNL